MPMERTPLLIRAALAAFPQARGPWIALGGGSGGGEAGHGAGGGEGVRAEDVAVGGGNGSGSKPVGRSKGPEGDASGGHQGRQGGHGKGAVEDATGAHPGGGVHNGDLALTTDINIGGSVLAPTHGISNNQGGGGSSQDSAQKYNPYLDLLVHDSPWSSFWKKAWNTNPLVLHDKHLVLAKKRASRTGESGFADSAAAFPANDEPLLDLSQKMVAIMNRHPGPISSFRVDSSKWTDDSVLHTWLKICSDKSAAEVTIMNLGHRTSTIFPVEEMQSPKLLALCLGFMTIPGLDLLCFNYSALQVLYLFGCSFQGLKLSWIISDCVSLRELHIGFCIENLKVNSKSLEMVDVWGTTADSLVIECAPKLTVLVTSVKPRRGCTLVKPRQCYPQVSISINGAPSLKTVNYLLLPYHMITVNSVPIMKECISWSSLESLKLGLNLSDRTQRDGLRKILDSLPKMLELCVLRMDEVAREERFDVAIDCPFEDLDHVTCVATCLRSFGIQNFRGGPAELHMIKSVLRHAPRLLEFYTIASRSCSHKQIGKATGEIESYTRLSEACHIAHHPTK